MVFHIWKTRSKATNVAEINRKSIRRICGVNIM